MLTRLIARYHALPKGVRFVLFYGSMLLWGPVVFLTLFLVFIALTPIAAVIELWSDYR